MYVEPLIGPETINTMPQETLDAYRDHGDPAPRLEQDLAQSQQLLQRLAELGIDRDQVARQLEEEGLEKFNKPFDKLLATLETKRTAALQAESANRSAPRLRVGEQRAPPEGFSRKMVGLAPLDPPAHPYPLPGE